MIDESGRRSEHLSYIKSQEVALKKMEVRVGAGLGALLDAGVTPEQLAGGTFSTDTVKETDETPAACVLMCSYDPASAPAQVATICPDDDQMKHKHIALALRAAVVARANLLYKKRGPREKEKEIGHQDQ